MTPAKTWEHLKAGPPRKLVVTQVTVTELRLLVVSHHGRSGYGPGSGLRRAAGAGLRRLGCLRRPS